MQAPSKPAKKTLNRKRKQPLGCIFSPKTVAVIGATRHRARVGRTVLWNLVTSPFGGTRLPRRIRSGPAFWASRHTRSISDIPEAGGPGGHHHAPAARFPA